ncbi:hypothetical protein NDU88_007784 [Pleurodeles waltl]|uniref:Uncharacterized protein n=1 Tax=Pleurodeles waltl TaxID=8319 RepID=A0AAV7LT75_PLEWA|nr:hypothetical protein NDU88_007784 [Pleurodeles waltl]
MCGWHPVERDLQNVIATVQVGVWEPFLQNASQWATMDRDPLSQVWMVKDGAAGQLPAERSSHHKPCGLHRRTVDLPHEGLQGAVTSKTCLREEVWFLGLDATAVDPVAHCPACQLTGGMNVASPTNTQKIPV